MGDMFRKLTTNGPIQILGEPAFKVDAPDKGVQYEDGEYKTAEEINVGLGGRFSIAAAVDAVTSTVAPIPAPTLALPFMTQRVTIPSSVALYLMLTSAKIAATDLIDGDAICADVFSEVSLNNGVRWPTAQTGQQIRVQMGNTDVSSAHEPKMTLTGVRLRT